ncbi:DUF4384 domain-containing protein [Thermus filiformis]|uniref:DUF4384 domain-containing protein n=1 Tax=Thermus filiformis TaxID=276 RepID=A0A0A2WR39_THEFI|nr:DUF4384 domain-containing protein [Thermus filiformis]KGQ21202.1 hypothetical protein THFILI_11625 [Thermus filiformis]
MRGLWLLLVLLSGCTLTFQPGGLRVTYRLDLEPVIYRFEPDRGPGGVYYVGEEVRFLLTLARPGYLALVAVDPDGRTYEFDRVYLPAGTHLLPNRPVRYTLTPPRGLYRVRAVYTEAPAPARVRLEGVYTDWDARVRVYLEASGGRLYDLAETYFYLR